MQSNNVLQKLAFTDNKLSDKVTPSFCPSHFGVAPVHVSDLDGPWLNLDMWFNFMSSAFGASILGDTL